MRTRRYGAVVAAWLIAIGASGCAVQYMTDDEWYADAREFNYAFKQAVAEVQSQISGDAWRVDEYGHVPLECDHGGYEFALGRRSPRDWHVGEDAETVARQVGDWLWERGWSVKLHTYGEGIDNVIITASNHEKHIARLYLSFLLGEATDSVILEATSTCRSGDPYELMDVLDPGWLTRAYTRPMPETEVPGTTPIFGFKKDGTPRSP